MKKMLLIFSVFCFLNASNAQSFSMQDIVDKASELVDLIEGDLNQEIVRLEFDIISGTKNSFRWMSDAYTYSVVAFGDYRIADIDVRVYKWLVDEWVLIGSDTDNNNVAVVEIDPLYSGDYKVEIQVYRFSSGYNNGHYGLIICH